MPAETGSLGESPSLVLGLDEAGRGSVIGPLVVGGFVLPDSSLGQLVELGVRDSKRLSPQRRAELFRSLGRVGSRLTVPLTPSAIDRSVAHGNLNHLEAWAFAHLVDRSRARLVYADACDPVEWRFGAEVARLSRRKVRVVARHRADDTVPIVGAASIVAKVIRDRHVARLRATVGEDFGSGYPSDPKTRAFVARTLERRGPAPSWLRRSWLTVERLMPRVPVQPLEEFA